MIRKYTQNDLADKVGLTPKEIHYYERGYIGIPIKILNKVAKALSFNIKALFLGLTKYENENDKVKLLIFIGDCIKN